MKVYIHTETHSSPDDRCGVCGQEIFTRLSDAILFHNKKCEEYRNDPDDKWHEDAYSDCCSYFNCGDDECELYLKEFEL